MNQLLDLLDIDLSIPIEIVLEPIKHNGTPSVRTMCNETILIEGPLRNQKKFCVSVGLLDKIAISIQMSDKLYSAEHETAVVIKSITIDGFEIVPAWTHLAVYHNERNYTDPTSYLGFNGTWQLDISEPFYRWRHRVTGQGWLLEPVTAEVLGSSHN